MKIKYSKFNYLTNNKLLPPLHHQHGERIHLCLTGLNRVILLALVSEIGTGFSEAVYISFHLSEAHDLHPVKKIYPTMPQS